MDKYILLPVEISERFNIQIDYILIHCTVPGCNNHWGVSLSTRENKLLTKRDLICQHCAADLQANKM